MLLLISGILLLVFWYFKTQIYIKEFLPIENEDFRGITFIKDKPASINDMKDCKTDFDCYYISRSSCCCDQWISINKKYKEVIDKYKSEFYPSKDCDDPTCTGVCGMSFYQPIGARCDGGKCKTVCISYDAYDRNDFTKYDCE